MRKLSLGLAAAVVVFTTNVWAAEQSSGTKPANPCKTHTVQADCTSDQACTWDTAKNKCKKAAH